MGCTTSTHDEPRAANATATADDFAPQPHRRAVNPLAATAADLPARRRALPPPTPSSKKSQQRKTAPPAFPLPPLVAQLKVSRASLEHHNATSRNDYLVLPARVLFADGSSMSSTSGSGDSVTGSD